MSKLSRSNLAGFSFLAPSLIGFSIFTLLPVVAAFGLSLFKWDLFNPPRFVGLDNFRQLLTWNDAMQTFGDRHFWKALLNTLFFMLAIPVTMLSSLLLAIALNKKLPGRIFFRTVYFIPTICSGVGLLLLWKFMYNAEFGLINRSLAYWFGIHDGPNWLMNPYLAKPAIMFMNVWISAGGTTMILYLAGLQGIPPELYEAAEIDGAGAWGKFWNVTVPGLKPTTFFIFTTALIGGFQGEFDSAYVLTQGGPNGATTTISYYIYQHGFEWFNMGYASAVSMLLFVLIFIVTLINWRIGGRQYA